MSTNNYYEKMHLLEQRTVDFSVLLVKTVGRYVDTPTLKPLVIQIIRSATSIGANYAEANNASSELDFRNKIYISKKEAAETKYWLKILDELMPAENFENLQQEAHELHLILQKITTTLNRKMEAK